MKRKAAGAAGLRIFWAWVAPGRRPRLDAVAAEGRALVTVAGGLILVLAVSGVVEAFERISGRPRVRLASLMDHAPGQRQFVDPTAYKTYYQRKMKLSDAEFAEFSRRRLAESEENADRNRIVLAARCHAAGISVASHDDATSAVTCPRASTSMTPRLVPTTSV